MFRKGLIGRQEIPFDSFEGIDIPLRPEFAWVIGCMKRLFILVLESVALLHAAAQAPVRTMTFDEASEVMFDSNASIRASEEVVRAATQERRAAIGLRVPTIAVSGAYSWMGDDVAIDLNGVKSGVMKGAEGLLPALDPALGQALHGLLTPLAARNWEFVLQRRSLISIGGTITMPIFTGGRINVANRAARIGEKIAESELQNVRGGLISQLVERYFGLLLAHHAVAVRRQVAEGLAQHLADARALESNGVIATSERLYVEYKVAEAERDLQKALLTEHTAREALSNTLGGEAIHPVTAIFVVEHPEDAAFFVDEALENNTLLRQAQLKEGLARENVRLKRADFFPQVAAMGAASFYNWQVSGLVPRWAVGVGVNLKLFNGLTREYKYSAARHTLHSVESMVAKAKSDIALLVANEHAEMINRLTLLHSIEASITFAQEYLRSKRVAFSQGMTTSADLIDAELNLAKARIERLEAAYEFDVALARLLDAAGISDNFTHYIKRADARVITF